MMDLKSSEPFWLVKNGILHSYPSLRENIDTEILVVGGGITGSLLAHRCMEEGYETTLIDRREIGHGSTSASTSMLQYEIDIPLAQLKEIVGHDAAIASYQACSDAIDSLEKIVRQVNSSCGFEKKESLYFAASRKDVTKLQQEFDARQEMGLPVSWLDGREIMKKYPLRHMYGGILSAQGGSVDVFRLAHDLIAYNTGKGLQVYDNTKISKVNYTTQGITATTEFGNKIKARHIIYCTGFESTEMIKENFVHLISTYAMVSEQEEKYTSALVDTLFWNTSDPYMYMRTTDDHRLLIGGEDRDFVNAHRRDALLERQTNRLKKYVSKILPSIDFRVDFSWAGTFGQTKDGLPYIGQHPDFPSAYFVLGFGGNGITFSVMGMDIISEMLKGRRHPLADYFRFKR